MGPSNVSLCSSEWSCRYYLETQPQSKLCVPPFWEAFRALTRLLLQARLLSGHNDTEKFSAEGGHEADRRSHRWQTHLQWAAGRALPTSSARRLRRCSCLVLTHTPLQGGVYDLLNLDKSKANMVFKVSPFTFSEPRRRSQRHWQYQVSSQMPSLSVAQDVRCCASCRSCTRMPRLPRLSASGKLVCG